MKLTAELIIEISKQLGIHFINKDINVIRLEIDAKLEELNEVMMPDKSTDTTEDFIIPKEFVKQYVQLMELQDKVLEFIEEEVVYE